MIETVFTSVTMTRSQGIIRVVVALVAVVMTFFWHSHFWKIFALIQYLNLTLLSVVEFVAYPIA